MEPPGCSPGRKGAVLLRAQAKGRAPTLRCRRVLPQNDAVAEEARAEALLGVREA